MDDRKKDQSIQYHANFDGDSATGDRTQIRQDQQNQQPPQIDPSLADAQAVAASLGVDPNTGLSQAEAERRLAQYGPNELASAPPVPKWKKFLAQFKDPLVYLLGSLPPASRSSHGSSKKPTLRQARKAAKYCRSTPSSLCLSLSSTRYSATFRNRKRKKPSKRSPK